MKNTLFYPMKHGRFSFFCKWLILPLLLTDTVSLAQEEGHSIAIIYTGIECDDPRLDVNQCRDANRTLKHNYASELKKKLIENRNLMNHQVFIQKAPSKVGSGADRRNFFNKLISNKAQAVVFLELSVNTAVSSSAVLGGSGSTRKKIKISAEIFNVSELIDDVVQDPDGLNMPVVSAMPQDGGYGDSFGALPSFPIGYDQIAREKFIDLVTLGVKHSKPNLFRELMTAVTCINLDREQQVGGLGDVSTESAWYWRRVVTAIRTSLPKKWNRDSSFKAFAQLHAVDEAKFLYLKRDERASCQDDELEEPNIEWETRKAWFHYQLEVVVLVTPQKTAKILVSIKHPNLGENLVTTFSRSFYKLTLKKDEEDDIGPNIAYLTRCLAKQFETEKFSCDLAWLSAEAGESR
ncbi:MAG: hypothetical protein COB37_02200 [Kordiimonadales bacterium]|nr:MAG: hypothetical protein COB37_02200 [Kordiimonadales bacterium]